MKAVINVYSYSELSDDAKKVALRRYRDQVFNESLYDTVIKEDLIDALGDSWGLIDITDVSLERGASVSFSAKTPLRNVLDWLSLDLDLSAEPVEPLTIGSKPWSTMNSAELLWKEINQNLSKPLGNNETSDLLVRVINKMVELLNDAMRMVKNWKEYYSGETFLKTSSEWFLSDGTYVACPFDLLEDIRDAQQDNAAYNVIQKLLEDRDGVSK